MDYKVIASGSRGNCTIIDNAIAVDMGISFKALKPYYKNIKLVCLTHIHSDHFNAKTIKKLASERPTVRFACGEHLKSELEAIGVRNIDVLTIGKKYDYGNFKISPIKLYHDVPNVGWRIYIGSEKAIYCTDTKTLDGISAKDYDIYFIEANYSDEELQKRIDEKEAAGEFIYEYSVPERHLSKQQADDFICANIGKKGVYVYMHQHAERGCRDA